jgi:hypothetical protein
MISQTDRRGNNPQAISPISCFCKARVLGIDQTEASAEVWKIDAKQKS